MMSSFSIFNGHYMSSNLESAGIALTYKKVSGKGRNRTLATQKGYRLRRPAKCGEQLRVRDILSIPRPFIGVLTELD